MPFLTPELTGSQLTVELALKQPTRITAQIARLATAETLVDKIFHMLNTQVQGGAFIFNQLKRSDYFVKNDVEQVGPGDEFPLVEGVDPEAKMALVEKWGGLFPVPDEKARRNDIAYLDNQTTQLANTIVRKVDTQALKFLEAALAGENIIPGHSWGNLVTVGDPATLTPSANLPSADLSSVHLVNALQELGVTADLLIVHPEQAHDLRVAFGATLDAMLKSAGMQMFENARLTNGTAYAVERGQVGIVGVEMPLTTETWREPKNQTSWVLAYVMPAFGVDRPYACKKLTGLA